MALLLILCEQRIEFDEKTVARIPSRKRSKRSKYWSISVV